MASQVLLMVNNLPAHAGDVGLISGSGRPLEEEMEMETHSGILAWRIPQTQKPGGLQSIGSQRVGHDRSHLAHTHLFGC